MKWGPVRRISTRAGAAIWRALFGSPYHLAPQVVERYPVLNEARWRQGGLPPRIAGWLLGQRTVAGVTLGVTIFLATRSQASDRLLLHELGHVRQFRRDKGFPMRYLWESIRRGYSRNRYEAEADQFAEGVIWSSTPQRP